MGATVKKGPIILDAVFMDDSTRGIEGVVRLTWWSVFSVTVQNRSRSEMSIPVSAFSLVDGQGKGLKALTLDEVLGYESPLIGPLMSYQRRAIRRAFWSAEPIAPGAFAVGYLFFTRRSNPLPCQLVLDPNPERRKDELIAVFSKPVEVAPATAGVAPDTTVAADSVRVSEPSAAPQPEAPAPSDTTGGAPPDTLSLPTERPAPSAEQPPEVEATPEDTSGAQGPAVPSE